LTYVKESIKKKKKSLKILLYFIFSIDFFLIQTNIYVNDVDKNRAARKLERKHKNSDQSRNQKENE